MIWLQGVMLMAENRRRVKVYVLNEERQWDDKGTGHVSSTLLEESVLTLIVQAEDDGLFLLYYFCIVYVLFNMQHDSVNIIPT